jgi:hypothetical protein
MSYTLDDFCAELRTVVAARGTAGLPDLAVSLSKLLTNPAFVAATFDESMPPGKRELAHDPVTGAYVLAHVHAPSRGGAPHTHGTSWAIYGNARGATAMTEYTKVDDGNPEGTALMISDQYTLGPGDTRAYHSGAIHSTANAEPTWVVRVTGTDLDHEPRYRFDAKRDRLVTAAGAAAS